MSKAAQLLKSKAEMAPKKPQSNDVVVDDSTVVDVPFYSRQSRVKAVARLYRIANAKLKTMETEVESLKAVLRSVGQQELDANADAGHYVTRVNIGGVHVSRANKFKPVVYDKDALVEAVGPVEYSVFFKEQPKITFDSIDKMRTHVQLCKDAGLEVDGKPEEIITCNSSVVEYIVKTQRSLDADKLALLKDCAQDQAARVGGK
jgi:hypothetical protein